MARSTFTSASRPRPPRRANPLMVLLVFLILAVALLYFLILVWEIPSPAQSNVSCRLPDRAPHDIFQGQNAPADLLCQEGFELNQTYQNQQSR